MIPACVAGMTETEALAAVAFWLPDVSRAAQKIRHRRGIADCRLPIADCRLPIADCRFYGNGVCGQVILVGLCHVFSFVLCQWLLPPTKAIIHKKTRMSSFFVKKFIIPAPACAGATAGINCRRAANVAAAKAADDWTEILYPRHSRVGGNPTAPLARS